MGDIFSAQRDVSFFLRIHGHLPDKICGDSFPFGECAYRPDKEPINVSNDYVDILRQNPEYCEKEKEVQNEQFKQTQLLEQGDS